MIGQMGAFDDQGLLGMMAIALNFKHVLGWKLPDGNYFGMANILIMVAAGGDCQLGGRCDFGLHCPGASNASAYMVKVRKYQYTNYFPIKIHHQVGKETGRRR